MTTGAGSTGGGPAGVEYLDMNARLSHLWAVRGSRAKVLTLTLKTLFKGQEARGLLTRGTAAARR